MCTWRARLPTLAISTDICWHRRLKTASALCKFKDVRRTKRDWAFYRATAQNILWPHIDEEYQQELQGIADGLKARGSKLDVWDVVALNAMEEVPDYYVPMLDKQEKTRRRSQPESAGQLQRVCRDRIL